LQQAPESPNQKRKRGQPTVASKHAPATASTATRASKRRKGADQQHKQQAGGCDAQEDADEGLRPRKRNKQSSAQEDDPSGAMSPSIRRPGRRPNPATSKKGDGMAPATTSRAKKASQGESSGAGGDQDESTVSQPRRSTRDRNSGDGTPWWEASRLSGSSHQSQQGSDAVSPQTTKKKKRGRPSLNEVSVAEVQNRKAPSAGPAAGPASEPDKTKRRRQQNVAGPSQPAKGHGAASPRNTSQAANDSVPKPASQRLPPGPRQSMAQEVSGPAVRKPTKSQSGKKRSSDSRQEEEASGDIADQAASIQEHHLLRAKAENVSRSAIAEKWSPLDQGAIAEIATLLEDAERSVLVRLSDNKQRREHARAAVSAVSRRIRFKLVRGMPFPPPAGSSRTTANGIKSGHEDDLDFERTVDSIQGLENQLDPLLHSIALLKREVDKESKELDDDYATLRALEANAKAEARTFRERIKRSHVLAPEVQDENREITTETGRPEFLAVDNDRVGRVFQVCLASRASGTKQRSVIFLTELYRKHRTRR